MERIALPPAARRLGWGVVGCGWVARDYGAPGIEASGNGRVAAVFDVDPAASARLASNVLGGRAATRPSLAALLDDPGVQAVYVATPNHRHLEAVEACAAAGKHVLCEKPMATNLESARRMLAACEAAGVLYATAFDQRFHAAHRRLRDLVAGGVLGVVSQARVHYACWLPPDWAADNWRVDPRRAGGGAMIDLAPHGVDLISMLLGDEWERLVALTQHRVHGYEVDDGAVLVGRTWGGVVASIQVAYNCPDSYPRRRLELIGTRAMALATDTMGQDPGGSLELIDAGTGRRSPVVIDPEDDRSPFAAQAEAFAASALEGRPYSYPPGRDLRNFALLEDSCR